MKWKPIAKVAIVIALLAIASGGVYWVNKNVLNADRVDTGVAATGEHPPAPVPIQAAEVKRITLRPALELVGNVIAIPERIAMVSPQLGGWVTNLDVHEGQTVKAGQTLVHLDDRTAKTDIQRTSAVVAEKGAALKRLKRGYLPQELEVAKQDRDKAKATADGLRSELKALEDLRKRGEISLVQYDSKVKALESADAAMASADAHLQLIQEGTPKELVEEAQAFLEAAQADEEHAKLTLQWCTIASPLDGVVTLLTAHQGQYFAQALPLATVIDLSNVFVQLRIPSRDFGKVRIGTKVDIQLSSIPDRTFQGAITRISGEADPLTGNVNMFALVDNKDGELRPGLACDARVWLPEIPDTLAVPVAAIGDHAGTPVVTLIRDGKTQETTVKLGAETREFFQVTSGLSEGDIVAISGGYGLPDGCPVKVLESASDNSASTANIQQAILRLVQTVSLPEVKGGFDLMAADVSGLRLFMNAEANGTTEVIDLEAGKHAYTIKGMPEPKWVVFRPELQKLYIANGGGKVFVLDSKTYTERNVIDFKEKANNLRYDSKTSQLFIGVGDTFGAIAIVDAKSDKAVAEIPLANYPKQFEIDGDLIYVNVPAENHIAVVSRKMNAVIAFWPVTQAKENIPMSIDRERHRLFVGCASGKLVVFDTTTGESVADLDIATDSDGISYDLKRQHIYISCGSGSLDVVKQLDADHYEFVGRIATVKGAATSIFDPELDRLFLAVPQGEGQSAELRIYAPTKL